MKLPWRERGVAQSAGSSAKADLHLPGRQQVVTLVMPDGERLPARVAKRERDHLLVLAMVRLQPLSEQQLQHITLEHSDRKGVVQLGGTVTLEDRELLRFESVQAIDVTQRREYVRVNTSRPVHVLLQGSSTPVETRSVDLSGGGMLLGGLHHVRVGERIGFRLLTERDGDGASQITGTGTVLRSYPSGQAAIVFDAISEGDRRRLIKFLFACQREERRKGLKTEEAHGR